MRDINQAIAVLDAMHHWRIQCHNSEGRRRGYECTIWNGGRRVNAYGQSPIAAIMRAIEKLKEPKKRSRQTKESWTPTLVCE